MPNGIALKGRVPRTEVPKTKEILFQIHEIAPGGDILAQEHKIYGGGLKLPNDPTKPAPWRVRFGNLARRKIYRLTVTYTGTDNVSKVRLRRAIKTFDLD